MRGGKFFAPGAKNIPARRSRRKQGPVSAAASRSKHRRAALKHPAGMPARPPAYTGKNSPLMRAPHRPFRRVDAARR